VFPFFVDVIGFAFVLQYDRAVKMIDAVSELFIITTAGHVLAKRKCILKYLLYGWIESSRVIGTLSFTSMN